MAALDLNAQLSGGEVKISGILTNTTYREEILATIAEVHGVTDINDSELLVRVPLTYTVVDGDTLWQIVTYFYGTDAATASPNSTRSTDDVLPSASALQVGMELKLPVVD